MRTFTFASLAAASLLTLAACGQSNAEKTEAPSPKEAETQATETIAPTSAPAAPVISNKTPFGALSEMTQGSEDAPVTIIEYASVTCPGCAYFHQNTYPKLKADYIDTGKVKFVFREFPTPPQQLSYLGFVLSRCVADTRGSEAYFAMLKTLFNNQQQWVSENWQSELLKYAAQAGMSEDDFKACIAREEILNNINETVKYGAETFEVSSTPTFIVNGEKMGRYSSEDEYFKFIDEAIAAAEVN